jgi:hypothetical protein
MESAKDSKETVIICKTHNNQLLIRQQNPMITAVFIDFFGKNQEILKKVAQEQIEKTPFSKAAARKSKRKFAYFILMSMILILFLFFRPF